MNNYNIEYLASSEAVFGRVKHFCVLGWGICFGKTYHVQFQSVSITFFVLRNFTRFQTSWLAYLEQ